MSETDKTIQDVINSLYENFKMGKSYYVVPNSDEHAIRTEIRQKMSGIVNLNIDLHAIVLQDGPNVIIKI